ncbi:MAG TPA: 5-(carboxyamino)imidazole ribonucleotide synthase [bacterium]|nr:5-(carboxyamino)imidazole ribonucleotide synthase [bacterium]
MIDNDKTKQKIGIIGGGQLGKMMILEAKKMGFYIIILDPTPSCPADSIADEHIVADFDDENAIRQLSEKADIITYEFEHIGVKILKELEEEGHKIYPTAKSLEIIQNKYTQKERLADQDIPVPDFIKVTAVEDIKAAADKYSYPLMLKSCTGGYDGKGNAVINNESEVSAAYKELGAGKLPLMVEEFIPFEKEISVLACRDTKGNIAVYPVGENEHRDNILYETRVPADISPQLAEEAMHLGHQVLEVFSGIGMFCIEMFVTKDEKLMINEIAPRPHNSGHYTIEGCITSQFEQHVRAITGLPLGDTSLIKPSVMRNILGTGDTGEALVTGIDQALELQNVKAHIYNKKIARPGRKMGHITVTDDNLQKAADRALKASEHLEIQGKK